MAARPGLGGRDEPGHAPGAGLLLTTQAGVQSVIVTTLVAAPGQAFSRWLDAVTGGVLALAIADLCAVIDPNANLSSEVIRAQARSMVVGLLMLIGHSYEEARQMVPDTHTAAQVARDG